MNIISIVYRKELKDILRDKKTVIAAILIPFLIYPIIFGFMGKGIKDSTEFLDKEGGIEMALMDEGDSSLSKFLKSHPSIDIKESDDIMEDVKSGKLLLGIEISKDFDGNINADSSGDINIIYDNSSQKSNMVMGFVDGLINEYSTTVVAQRLKARDIDTNILTPINMIVTSPDKDDSGFGKLILSMMLPMMLIIFAASGPIASAVDLGAGEKERGTLEPLLTTQSSRTSLLWGKFLAITTMGIATSLAFIGGLGLSMKTSPEAFGMIDDTSLSLALEPRALIIIGLITIFLTMVFGALALSISIYARSFKEAQTYLTPLSFIGMLGFTSYFIEPKTMSKAFLHIPIINAVVIIKELTLGIFNIAHIAILFLWMLIYIVIAISFARYMFTRESVIFRT
ncbi:MAG: ABC transporter permease [Clostridiales bacterium]|nr:ABC transporter permease [Clostridiales bacterium]